MKWGGESPGVGAGGGGAWSLLRLGVASSRRGSVLRGKQRNKLSAESEGRWELNQTQGLCGRASPCQGRTILRVS